MQDSMKTIITFLFGGKKDCLNYWTKQIKTKQNKRVSSFKQTHTCQEDRMTKVLKYTKIRRLTLFSSGVTFLYHIIDTISLMWSGKESLRINITIFTTHILYQSIYL